MAFCSELGFGCRAWRDECCRSAGIAFRGIGTSDPQRLGRCQPPTAEHGRDGGRCWDSSAECNSICIRWAYRARHCVGDSFDNGVWSARRGGGDPNCNTEGCCGRHQRECCYCSSRWRCHYRTSRCYKWCDSRFHPVANAFRAFFLAASGSWSLQGRSFGTTCCAVSADDATWSAGLEGPPVNSSLATSGSSD